MVDLDAVPLNKIYLTGKEMHYIAQANLSGQLAGDGPFTKQCQSWLQEKSGSHGALLTHSCTAALEMAALLLNIQPGDEIIMSSYTFVSTANAFVLRGGVPVFVDIRPDTLNLDEKLIEGAITARTRVVVPVHYAGVACEMNSINALARRYGLKVVEDAAQGIMATYCQKPLGGLGDLGAYSFHATKNVVSGEGGALLINDPELNSRADIIREKGTDRSRFFRGEVDKYTWQEVGSSFLPSELNAAFLWAQLQEAELITQQRLACWHYYHTTLAPLEEAGLLRRPTTPMECQPNGHIYYIILGEGSDPAKVLQNLRQNKIGAAPHYAPLHQSPGGIKYGMVHDKLAVTDMIAERLLRLPLWPDMLEEQQQRVVKVLSGALNY